MVALRLRGCVEALFNRGTSWNVCSLGREHVNKMCVDSIAHRSTHLVFVALAPARAPRPSSCVTNRVALQPCVRAQQRWHHTVLCKHGCPTDMVWSPKAFRGAHDYPCLCYRLDSCGPCIERSSIPCPNACCDLLHEVSRSRLWARWCMPDADET